MKHLVLGLCFAFASISVAATPPRPTSSIDGKTLFRQYCASCHGVEGTGSGPVASSLKQVPSDLTQIAHLNNGKFPEERMMRILQGSEPVKSHGTSEMPVWGPVFYGMNTSLTMGQTQMYSLVHYLEMIQAKQTSVK